MYTLISVILVLWLLGFIGHVGGDFIHALLLVAGALFILNLISGRSTTV